MNALIITPYQRRYRHAVSDLMFRSYLIHTHLDWHETDEWLDRDEAITRLLWEHDRLLGVLAVSKPLNQMSWIRLAVVQTETIAQTTLARLWENLSAELRQLNTTTVALLITRDWIAQYSPALGFDYIEDIITLYRNGHQLPPRRVTPFFIRNAENDDLKAITTIDHAAFSPPWQMSIQELQQAKIISAICTVALLEGDIVGYQLSTLYRDGAHLARLAVMPDIQSHGAGSTLLDDVLHRFFRRGVKNMTVNTQASNQRSQRLYARYGFRPNGYDLPVWMASL